MKKFLSLIGLGLTSSIAAAPPPPASASFVPAIAYTYANSTSRDLRLSDEAGSAALLVFRQVDAIQFDLSPRAVHRVAYIASTNHANASVQYKSWDDSSGQVTLSPATTVFTTDRYVYGVDFSPDGNRLAFGSYEYADSKLDIYDIGNPAAGPTTILSGYRIWGVRWRSDGMAIYFTGYPAGTSDPIKVYQVAPDGSGLTALFNVAPGTNPTFDTSRPSLSGFQKILIDYRASNLEPVYLRAYNSDGTFNQLGTGSFGHYNCANDHIIYQQYATRKPPTLIGTADLSSSTVWSSDSNIGKTDWIPC